MQNPLGSYRRTQRELRRSFEAFTRANCPACPTPCCRQPARIAPTDILLAEATGWRSAVLSASTQKSAASEFMDTEVREETQSVESADMVMVTATRMLDALSQSQQAEAEREAREDQDLQDKDTSLPCEFLGAGGCTFPTDLRPFGCTTYICKYMYAKMDRATLTRIKRLTRELADKHAILMRTARHTGLSILPPESGD